MATLSYFVESTLSYFPELHYDRPTVGSLECILFSGSDGAVVTLSDGAVVTLVGDLNVAKMIALGAETLVHAKL